MSFGYRFSDQPTQPALPEILSAIHYQFAPPHRITYHRPEIWVLNYPLEIHGVLNRAGRMPQWLPVQPRLANLYPAHTEYWEDYRHCTDRTCRSLYILFSPGQYAPDLLALCDPAAGFTQFEDPEHLLGQRLRETADLATGGATRFLAVNGMLHLIFDLLLHFSTPTRPASHRRVISGKRSPVLKNIPMAESLTQLFNENPAAPFSIDYLADRLHVSRSTLSHRYAATYGETPMQAILRLRINLCRELLAQGLPTRAIAQACGFCDEFHLMKAFKRTTGQTLGEYRRQLQPA